MAHKYILMNGKGNPRFGERELIPKMYELGHIYLGNEIAPDADPRVKGLPRFSGLTGPTYIDSTFIRYDAIKHDVRSIPRKEDTEGNAKGKASAPARRKRGTA